MHISEITTILEANRNPEKAAGAKAYMKHLFEYLGIQKPIRKELVKPFLHWAKKTSYNEVNKMVLDLWNLPEREYQYLALEMLQANKNWKDKNSIKLFEKLLTDKSWWDSVDTIATHCIAGYFTLYPEKRDTYIEDWMASNNMWLQRTCLIFQLHYKENTDTELLFNLCNKLKKSKEFFIQKAIGWALRQYARTNPVLVYNFVNTNNLKPLSRREALKHFGK